MLFSFHISPLFKRCRLKMLIASLCAFIRRGQFVLGKQNWRNSHFRFTKLISQISFSLFVVNCAFIFVSDYAIATSFSLLVQSVSLLRKRPRASALWTPDELCSARPAGWLRIVQTNFSFANNSAFRIPNSEFYSRLSIGITVSTSASQSTPSTSKPKSSEKSC